MSEVILIADDEKEIADLVALYLENEGFRIVKCYDGAMAMEMVENERLDLAILDIMLPGASGLDICRKIRERHNYPIIMLTAKGEEMDKITGLTMGADDYMTKPFLPHGAHQASEGKDGRFLRASEIHQDSLGVRVQD